MRKMSVSLLVVALCLTCSVVMSAENPNVLTNPQVSKAIVGVTPPIRDLVKNMPQTERYGYHVAPPVQQPKAQQLLWNAKHTNYAAFKDAAAQNTNQPATIPVDQLDWLGVGVGFLDTRFPMPRPTAISRSATPRSCNGSTLSSRYSI